ncbi:hypothetical protein AMTRI_Chr12g272100 [Amborella trichopoda]
MIVKRITISNLKYYPHNLFSSFHKFSRCLLFFLL